VSASRREADIERVRALAASSAGRVGIVTVPAPGLPRFVLDLDYATVGSMRYPAERQPRSRIAIELAARHPFEPPVAKVLTPVFHPNVFASGVICQGARWLPSDGMDLFVKRIVRLLAFDPLLVNTQSAANGAAAQWYAAQSRLHPSAFPTDRAALALGETPERVVVACPQCGRQLRLPAGRRGSVQCPLCQRAFEAAT
jgi:uncharacterized Zn-finger protein